MGKKIQEEIIEQVRTSSDIVDVVGEYVQLRKQGRNYFGLCPFHNEKSPSFSVAPDKGIFHCFGCGAGGNVFNFIMKIENLDYLSAVRKLATRAGIPLPEESVAERDVQKHQEWQALYDAHKQLAHYYQHILLHTEEGKTALQYLIGRGLTMETIKEFRLGYAPNAWDFSMRFLQKRGFSLQDLITAGLVIEKEDHTGYFDRFRHRIIFPIENNQGDIVAFSGRALEESGPKYLNSTETPIFKKGEILYNIHRARRDIRRREEMIITEGYLDVISVYQSGYLNVVATMGTALSNEQMSRIRRMTNTVVLFFDSDRAGQEATVKAGTRFAEFDTNLYVLSLPKGYDPNQYIQEFGNQSFQERMEHHRQSFLSFKLDVLRSTKNLKNDTEKFRYIEEAIHEIAKLDHAIEREHYLNTLSREFQISLDILRGEIQKSVQNSKSFRHKQQVQQPQPSIERKKHYDRWEAAERMLITHLLNSSEWIYVVQHELPAFFPTEELTEIFIHLLAYYEEGNESNVSKFLDYIKNPNLRNLVTELDSKDFIPEPTESEIRDYIRVIEEGIRVKEMRLKEIEMKQAEREGDMERAMKLLFEIHQLRKQLKV